MATHLNHLKRQLSITGILTNAKATQHYIPHDEPLLRFIYSKLEGVVPFFVEDVREFNNFKYIPELFRLPFKNTWVEFKVNEGKNVTESICVFLTEDDDVRDKNNKIEDGIAIAIMLFGFRNNQWCLIGGFIFYPEVNKFYDSEIGHDKGIFGKYGIPPLDTSRSNEVITNIGFFLSALNCTNIKAVETKEPKFINKKRKKKGKLPIESFWTLQLSSSANEKNESQGGTHSSPRLHLRRGHVRQYKPGLYTWVNACAVGDASSGTVDKDYKL